MRRNTFLLLTSIPDCGILFQQHRWTQSIIFNKFDFHKLRPAAMNEELDFLPAEEN